MTGDRNPLHYDAALAAASPFGGLIVQGGVTSGLLNAIVAEDLPGPGTVFLGVEWRFVKAVGVGEQITGRVEVTGVRDDKPICTLATSVRNAQGEDCLVGTAVTYTVPLRRPRVMRSARALRACGPEAAASACFGTPGAAQPLQVAFHQTLVAAEEEIGSGGMRPCSRDTAPADCRSRAARSSARSSQAEQRGENANGQWLAFGNRAWPCGRRSRAMSSSPSERCATARDRVERRPGADRAG